MSKKPQPSEPTQVENSAAPNETPTVAPEAAAAPESVAPEVANIRVIQGWEK